LQQLEDYFHVANFSDAPSKTYVACLLLRDAAAD
jgi:hypothetical protein